METKERQEHYSSIMQREDVLRRWRESDGDIPPPDWLHKYAGGSVFDDICARFEEVADRHPEAKDSKAVQALLQFLIAMKHAAARSQPVAVAEFEDALRQLEKEWNATR